MCRILLAMSVSLLLIWATPGCGDPQGDADTDYGVKFAHNAFPPLIPDLEHHRRAWIRGDCLKCHEKGLQGAPRIRHEGMEPILLEANCRTCHLLIRSDSSLGN